jgi:hypothetical protein
LYETWEAASFIKISFSIKVILLKNVLILQNISSNWHALLKLLDDAL